MQSFSRNKLINLSLALEQYYDLLNRKYKITVISSLRHTATLGTDLYGNIQRLDNTLESLTHRLQSTQDRLTNTRQQLEEAEAAVDKPFPNAEDLSTKSARLAELNALLEMDRPENEIVDSEQVERDSPKEPEYKKER